MRRGNGGCARLQGEDLVQLMLMMRAALALKQTGADAAGDLGEGAVWRFRG